MWALGKVKEELALCGLNSAKTELFRELTSPGLQAGSRQCQTSDMDLGSGEQAAVPLDLPEISPGPQVAVLTTQPWPSHVLYS